jgi:hypothetical protein
MARRAALAETGFALDNAYLAAVPSLASEAVIEGSLDLLECLRGVGIHRLWLHP